MLCGPAMNWKWFGRMMRSGSAEETRPLWTSKSYYRGSSLTSETWIFSAPRLGLSRLKGTGYIWTKSQLVLIKLLQWQETILSSLHRPSPFLCFHELQPLPLRLDGVLLTLVWWKLTVMALPLKNRTSQVLEWWSGMGTRWFWLQWLSKYPSYTRLWRLKPWQLPQRCPLPLNWDFTEAFWSLTLWYWFRHWLRIALIFQRMVCCWMILDFMLVFLINYHTLMLRDKVIRLCIS